MHTQIPRVISQGRENICWEPPFACPVISNLTLCCCMSHPVHCDASGLRRLHMQDCFRGSSLALLLWLVNVCHFIAYSIWMFLMQCSYLLFVLQCVWNCSINRVNRAFLLFFPLNGLELMEHKAPNMEGFSYYTHTVDWWPAAVPTARWCYWDWRHAPPDACWSWRHWLEGTADRKLWFGLHNKRTKGASGRDFQS